MKEPISCPFCKSSFVGSKIPERMRSNGFLGKDQVYFNRVIVKIGVPVGYQCPDCKESFQYAYLSKILQLTENPKTEGVFFFVDFSK